MLQQTPAAPPSVGKVGVGNGLMGWMLVLEPDACCFYFFQKLLVKHIFLINIGLFTLVTGCTGSMLPRQVSETCLPFLQHPLKQIVSFHLNPLQASKQTRS